MPRLEWDKNEERQFEMGVSKMVLFPKKTDGSGTYDKGVAWNGVTGVTESPSGADVTDLWADNIKYAYSEVWLALEVLWPVELFCLEYRDLEILLTHLKSSEV